MATSWDRASPAYVEEWAPRFAPYHGDLVREVGLAPTQRVLMVCAGPAAVVYAARAVGENGRVRVVDPRPEMLEIVRDKVDAAGVGGQVETAHDLGGPPWDAVLSVFGSIEIDIASELHSWADVLDPKGKLGLLLWGPTEPDDPLALVEKVLADKQPGPTFDRAHLGELVHAAGLVMVRHTIVRHTVSFLHAEELARNVVHACTWRPNYEAQGEAKGGKLLAKVYDALGGPDAPVAWEPPATLAIAGLPGSEIDLPHRPSVKIPLG